jgi:hypothetical protein
MSSITYDMITVREIKSIRIRWAGHVARMKRGWSAFKIAIDKSTGRRLLGRPRRRRDKNIRTDHKEICQT